MPFPLASSRAVIRASSFRPAFTAFMRQPLSRVHTLVLPDGHDYDGVVPFENGVPANQVRSLTSAEKNWDFWTSSDAFSAGSKPETGLKAVPFGQAWVIKRGGSTRVVSEGSTLIIPFVDKVVSVKNTHPVAMGVISPVITLKNGSSVNVYVVAYVKITDFLKSTTYIDPETNKLDSERAAAKLIKRTLENELPSFISGSSISEADKSKIEEMVKSAVATKSSEYGLEVTHVELRGVFGSDANLPDKIRALDPPQPAADAPGHNLKADYWADVLSPPFFEKKKFGSQREHKTPAAVTLEWVCPSPPDYHHFHELPRMTVAPTPAKEVEKSSH